MVWKRWRGRGNRCKEVDRIFGSHRLAILSAQVETRK